MNPFELHYRWKFAGWFLILAGTILATRYIWFDFRFSIPVFAVFSWFLEKKFLAIFPTNFSDETVLIFLVAGFFLVVFSKSKNFKNSKTKATALWRALFVNTVIMLFSILFIYGQGFVFMLIFNLISIFIIYLIFLAFAQRKAAKENSTIDE